MQTHRWLLLLSLLIPCTAAAIAPLGARKHLEASMLVTGQVTIEPDGSVSAWELDQREKLPEAVAGIVDRAARQWKFEPPKLDPGTTRGVARMSLLMVAKPADDDRFQVSIRSGNFGRDALAPDERLRQAGQEEVTPLQMPPPTYPVRAAAAGARATVYLVLRIGRQGTVEEAAVEQVNLRNYGSEPVMRQMRDEFASSALGAARGWTFNPPTRGPSAESPDWSVRVPVAYLAKGESEAGYGQWQAYIPGPRSPVPWQLESMGGIDIAPDALVAGGVYQVGSGMKLLTPLQGS